MPEYIVQKVPVVIQVQGNRNGRNTPDPIPAFEWRIVHAVTGRRHGDAYNDEARAEAACLRLNQQGH